MKRNAFCVLAVSMLASNSPTRVAAQATFTRLGSLQGGAVPSSFAVAVSGDGTVVAGGAESSNGNEAFAWTGGVMTGLGYIPPAGSTNSEATGVAISPFGDAIVVGQSWNGSQFEAFRHEGSGPMQGLGGLCPCAGNILSIATGISDDSTTIVGWSRADPILGPDSIEAWRIVGAGAMTGLGDLPGGLHASVARAASSDGSLIVGDSVSAAGSEAFLWTEAEGMQSLGDLPGGPVASVAFDISDDGRVIVGRSDAGSGDEAVIWVNGEIESIGTLPSEEPLAQSLGVSGDGRVVVGSSFVDPFIEATIWTRGTGLRHLETVLVNEYGLDEELQGWILFEGRAISQDGTVIVGQGLNPDNVLEGWMVTIPALPSPGDMNCDAEVDVGDIPEFVAALLDDGTFTGCDAYLADFTLDGKVDGEDVPGFTNQLVGS